MVIVTEGQLDAIVTDGCATGRNNINDDQAEILKSLDKEIIVLPDQDEAGKMMCKSAIKHGSVYLFQSGKIARMQVMP